MRSSRSQRRPSAWGAAAAAALVGGGCLVACYSGRPRVFPTVLAQNHRISSLERDSEGSSNPAPGPAQDHPQESHHVPESTVQMLLELIQAWCCGS